MSETHELGKERRAEHKGAWGSSWEYEDCRSLRKRNLAEPGGLHAENDLDTASRAKRRNRPYRKRDCGYWDFEQSDSGETNGRGRDGLFPEGYAGSRTGEEADCVHLRPGTEEHLLLGSLPWILEAGGCGTVNGCVDCKDLICNPDDLQKAKHRNGYRDVSDLETLHQPRNWYLGLGNFNYSLEDCKGISVDHKDHRASRHVPGSYTNSESMEPPDLNGVNEAEESVRDYEEDRKVCLSNTIYPTANTYPADLANSDTENKSYDTFSPNSQSHDYRQVDSPHRGEDLQCDGIDRLGMRAPGGRGAISEGLRQHPGGEQGGHHFGIPGDPALESTWHLGAVRTLTGPETWRRNSCFRRTAPGTLRRSEFVQRRKKPQGRDPASLLAG